jgi:hypothetical protein
MAGVEADPRFDAARHCPELLQRNHSMAHSRSIETWGVVVCAVLSCGAGILLVLLPAACVDQGAPYRVSPASSASGYFSYRGLPPVSGALTLTGAEITFRSSSGFILLSYRTVDRVAAELTGEHRPAARLAYTGRIGSKRSYVCRLEDGIFETEDPGPLLHSLANLVLLRTEEYSGMPSANSHPPDTAAMWEVVHRLANSAYADTLYALFGRPRRPLGLVGARGARAGNLAEYVHDRDSVAMDPARITSQDQLRHAFAHELAHRWDFRAPAQVDSILSSAGEITDHQRYGYQATAEQRAEAIAFAVHFLQSTASGDSSPSDAVDLLRHYDFLVPGSAAMARFLAHQPIYRHHPLWGDRSGRTFVASSNSLP